MTDRPDDLDPLALYAIDRVAEGATLVEIGEAMGLSGGAVFSRVTANAELQRRYQLSRETAADLLETELLDVIRSSTDKTAKADRVKLAGLQWVLARRCPRRYADRVALEHTSPDSSMSPAGTLDVAALSEAALSELMAARKR